ncbi:hypothetical protein CR513_62652, partial [Mucuna pruriens]
MEDEVFGEGSALIFGQPFLMTTRTKINVHAGILPIDEVPETFQYVEFPIANTSKSGVTRVATLINIESDFWRVFRKANMAESNSKGKKKVETNSNI